MSGLGVFSSRRRSHPVNTLRLPTRLPGLPSCGPRPVRSRESRRPPHAARHHPLRRSSMPHSQTSAPRDSRAGVRLARGASPWLLPTVATAALSLVRARRSGAAKAVAVPATALAAGMLWFFRDPERDIAQGRVISPADGVVQSIMPWKDGRTPVAIFMSPLNVHVNRAPLAGTVTSVEHVPGGFVPAFNKESENNERVV